MIKSCRICSSKTLHKSFPYEITFEDSVFEYYKCNSCKTTQVANIPSDEQFERIYQKDQYHDEHYLDLEVFDYKRSIDLLSDLDLKFFNVLDYGCGIGYFIKLLNSDHSAELLGVEFDDMASNYAKKISGCNVVSLAKFQSNYQNKEFDLIHLGDVFEHLSNPIEVIEALARQLSDKGYLYIEGPLEENPTLVHFCIKLFGFFSRLVSPKKVRIGKPTHLYRFNAKTQLKIILNLSTKHELIHFSTYDTGWPYIGIGFLKNLIAKISISFDRLAPKSLYYGNRFRLIIRKK